MFQGSPSVALGPSQLDELGSHLVLPISSKSTRLFAVREHSSLSSPKASLSLSSPGEPSFTANSNLSRQFSVCQAAEPIHRFNLFNNFSMGEPSCMCLVSTVMDLLTSTFVFCIIQVTFSVFSSPL